MNTSEFARSDPLLILLNEIDILLAQIRLAELHVKRAQWLASERMAQLKEAHGRELEVLRSDLEKSRAAQRELQQEVEFLNQQLREERDHVEKRDLEIRSAESELIGLREQVRAAAGGAALEAPGESARGDFRETPIHEDPATHESTDGQFEPDRAETANRLQKAELRANQAAAALDQAQRENTALHCRLAEIEVLEREAASRAAHELAETRSRFQRELAELRASSDARERLLEQQRVAAGENERGPQRRLLDLQNELERAGAAGLESRNRELVAQLEHLKNAQQSREDEIRALRHQVSVKERELTGRHEAVTGVELALHAKIQRLQQTLSALHHEIEERERALELARSQTAGLQRQLETTGAARFTAVGTGRQEHDSSDDPRVATERARLESKLAELRLRLAEEQLLAGRRAAEIEDLKEARRRAQRTPDSPRVSSPIAAGTNPAEFAEGDPDNDRKGQPPARLAQPEERLRKIDGRPVAREQEAAAAAAGEPFALAHNTQLRKIEEQIAEQERALAAKDCALTQAREREAALSLRLAGFEAERRRARSTFDNILSEEHLAMKTDDLNPEDSGPNADVESEGLPSAAEQTLRDEIVRLREEAQERNRILEDRNDELVRVKLRLDHAQERLAQLERTVANEGSMESETKRMRTEFQAQLALMQAELSQKEWAFEEHQAEASGRERRLRQEIETLRRQLIKPRDAAPDGDFEDRDLGRFPETSLALNGSDPQASEPGRFASQRRWHRSFGRKRRWRS